MDCKELYVLVEDNKVIVGTTSIPYMTKCISNALNADTPSRFWVNWLCYNTHATFTGKGKDARTVTISKTILIEG